ncbi:MAG: hypothetical protein ACI4I2_11530 [Oscillospiraceae bacterium]
MDKTEIGSKIIAEYIEKSSCDVSLGTLINYLVNHHNYTETEAKACCTEFFKNNQLEPYKDPVSIFHKQSQ